MVSEFPDIDRRDLEAHGFTLEYKYGMKTVAQLRALLLKLAYRLNSDDKRGIVLLNEPILTNDRIDREWAFAEQTLRADVLRKIIIVRRDGRQLSGWPEKPDDVLADLIGTLLRSEEKTTSGCRLPRPDAPSIVLRILVDRWLSGNEPVTTARLMELSGFSYPTVARALEQYEDALDRTRDRRVHLAHFPETHWHALIVNADPVRATLRYRDVSGTSLSIEHMLSRIDWDQSPALALGGARAARVIYPQLDLVGDSRLDLCVHAPGNHVNLQFVEGMNSALQRIEPSAGRCDLALHFVRSANPMFWLDGHLAGEGPPLARPAEVLLDLSELGYIRQAEEMRRFLERKHG